MTGIDEPAEGFVSDVLRDHLIRCDHEGLSAVALAQIKGKRLNIAVPHVIQCTPGGAVAHMNHSVAQPVIPYIEFPRQPFSNDLKTIPHVQTDILHIVQGFIDALTQQRLRYLQTLAAYIRLPFDPLDGAASALLQRNRSPSADGGDIVVVELLELEKEPMLYIVKALMENRVLFPAGKMAVQHDGICFNSHRNRRRVRARAR